MKIDVVVYADNGDRMTLGDVVVHADSWLEGVPGSVQSDINFSILSDQLELVLHRKPVIGGERNEDGTKG